MTKALSQHTRRMIYSHALALALLFPFFLTAGCGGGSSTIVQPPPVGPPSPPPFQARAFPGDFFMRLPTASEDGTIPAAVYDINLKEVFVSDPNFNSVEVYSTVDGKKIGEISVPGPAGLSFSPDFSKLYVGTITPYVYIVDPSALHITGMINFPPSMLTLSLGATGATLMPVMPYPMADGSVMLGTGYTQRSSSSAAITVTVEGLIRYEPTGGTFTPANPGPSDLAATPARSLDGKFLFVYGFGSAGYELLIYSASTQGYLPVSGQVQNVGVFLAANADGSQYATVQEVAAPGTGSFYSQVNFWGANLQPETQTNTVMATASGAIFSRDGKYLYLITGNSFVVALSTQTATPSEYFTLSLGSNLFPTSLLDVDETYHLFGVAPGGAYIVDGSHGQTTPPSAAPQFVGAASTEANPNVGPLTGGTSVQFIPAPTGSGSADGIASSIEAYFGVTPATQDVVAPYPSSTDGENFLTATSPAATTSGPVNVSLIDSNNNTVLLPDAFSYGPRILRVEPDAASAAGGDFITIYAYGLGFFFTQDEIKQNIHVSIGGVQLDMSKATLNTSASTNYPEQSITVAVPQGTPGWADVVVATNNGSDTLKRGIQYLNQEVNLSGGPFGFAVYDSTRDLFYLTGNGKNVSVFNPDTQAMGNPLLTTSASSGAILQAEALTPDNSKLLVADPADQSVIVFDLTAGTSSAVSVQLGSDPANTQVQPAGIVVAANNRAFVSLAPCVSSPLREINLTNFAVEARVDAAPSCTLYNPYPEYGGVSSDGSTIIYAGSSGQEFGAEPSGPEYIWSYNAASDTFTGPVVFSDSPWVGGMPAVSADGSVLAVAQGVLAQSLLPLVPIAQPGFDARLNETGSLLYTTGVESGQLSVSETHNGRWLLMLAAQNTSNPNGPSQSYDAAARPLAIDPTGTKILLASQGGLSYFDLAIVPLSVGSVTPTTTASGSTIQLRGSGFVTGTTAMIGGHSAACSFTDTETLSCTVPTLPTGSASIALTNPDGQTYSFENAFVVQ